MENMRIFTGIKEMLTLAPAAAKDGRRIDESDLGIIRDGALVEANGRILWVGEKKNLRRALKNLREDKVQREDKRKGKDEEIQLKAESLLPAFSECHTHLVFAGDRQSEFELRNQGMSYQEIAKRGGGILSTVQRTREAQPRDLLRLAETRAQEFLRQGVTTIEVKSGYGLSEKDELKILSVAKKIKSARIISTYLGPHAIPKGRPAEEYLEEILTTTLPWIKKQNFVERVDMFVEDGYYNLEHARRYYERAQKLGFRLTSHAEQLTRTGVSRYLAQLGADSIDHVVQINDDDIRELAKTQTTAVLLPTSDFYLKMRYPPARQLIDAGVRVALATDYNPGSSPTQDLSFVGVLARLEMRMKLAEVIGAYTLGAACALHRQNDLGSLEPGKLSDFVTIEGSWRDLFYQVGHHPVAQVFKAGQCVFLKKS